MAVLARSAHDRNMIDVDRAPLLTTPCGEGIEGIELATARLFEQFGDQKEWGS